MLLSERVRLAREAAGLTQAQLAKACGIAQPSVHDLESGRTKNPRSSSLLKIANALGQTPEWLVNGTGELSSAPASEIISPDEEGFLQCFRKLSAVEKKVVVRMIRALVIDK
jgi:transcriptional regulator with XRE-family HTH domain